MAHPYITKIPRLISWLIIVLFALFVLAKLTYPIYAPKLTVRLEIEPTVCAKVELNSSNHNPLFGFTSTGQSISLNPDQSVYEFPLNSLSRTAMWKFCPGSEITLKSITVITNDYKVNLPLNDTDHLMCYDCIGKIQSSGGLKLIPNPSRVSFQLGGIYEFVNAKLPKSYLIIYRLPQIIVALFIVLFALTAVPLTINLLEYISYCLFFGLFIMARWSVFRSWFPPASYSSNQIIADAQYLGFSIIADFAIMACLLAVPFLFALLLQFRNRLICRHHPSTRARLITAGSILIILIALLIQTRI